MQISVPVEPVAGNGYRAKGAEPFGFSAEGATREEAVAILVSRNLRDFQQVPGLTIEDWSK